MELEILEKLGLTRAEIKIYVALVELGISTVGPLSKKSNVPTSHIYPLLENLTNNGLISHTITANKRFYKAEDPKRLKEFLEEQKKQIENQEPKIDSLISELTKKYKNLEKTQEAFTYEGIKGVKTALEFVLKILKRGDNFYVIDASGMSKDLLMGYFSDFSKRRAKQGINYKIIYDFDSLEYAKERKQDKLTEVKILPKDIKIPSVFWVFKGYVVIAVFSENPIALMIKNKHISEGFMANFNILWNISKKL